MLNPSHTHEKSHDRYNWTPPLGENVWHLPGYAEDGVTYESHEFWVKFRVWEKKPDNWKVEARPDATLWVRHGGGVRSIEVCHMFARPLRDMFVAGGDTRIAHRLCWGVFDLARCAASNERSSTLRGVFEALHLWPTPQAQGSEPRRVSRLDRARRRAFRN